MGRPERNGPASAQPVDLTVPAQAAGQRLDVWLAEAVTNGSRSLAQRLIEAGQVLVGGRTRPKSYRLDGGERVQVATAVAKEPLEAPAGEARITWEDEALLIIDKPPGLVVHPAPGHRGITLVEALSARLPYRPLVVHRLDKGTSGLMLMAKRESVRRALQELIRRRELEREYLALVAGHLSAREGTIEAAIGRDRRRRTRVSTQTAKPREARTHFKAERAVGGFTLLKIRLETGRTHQVRAHFAAIGHPLCGDTEYGGPSLTGLDRQFLHSARLAFAHPCTGEPVEERSPLPPDLARALRLAAREAQ